MASQQLSRRQLLQTAAAAAVAKSADAQSRPNILFIMADEFRTDAMGCAGNPIVKTPNLDGLAGQGVRFSHTYCQGPLCQPSRASVMTGQYVHQHGQTYNAIDMNPAWPTMMKALRKAGYATAKVGKRTWSREAYRPKRIARPSPTASACDKTIHKNPANRTPYTEYLKSKGLLDSYRADLPDGLSDFEGMYGGKTSPVPAEHFLTTFVADRAIDWLRNAKQDKPYFMWVSFIEPHPPVIDTSKWASKYKSGRIPVGPVVAPDIPDNAYGRFLRRRLESTGSIHMTEESAERMARHYYGMVSLVDQKIGDILRTVKELGQDKNTWIFFTADHREMLGQHKMVYKNVFYKGSVRVPNIVRPPGGMTGRTVDGLVESIDLTATISDVSGAQMPLCKGRSLAPFTKGQGKTRDVAYSELAGIDNKDNYFVMAATERYRYMYDKKNNLPCELFDLEKDPDELHNLVNDPSHAGIRKDMHKDHVLPFMNS